MSTTRASIGCGEGTEVRVRAVQTMTDEHSWFGRVRWGVGIDLAFEEREQRCLSARFPGECGGLFWVPG